MFQWERRVLEEEEESVSDTRCTWSRVDSLENLQSVDEERITSRTKREPNLVRYIRRK